MELLDDQIESWIIENIDDSNEYDLRLKITVCVGDLARAVLINDIQRQREAIGCIYIAYMSLQWLLGLHNTNSDVTSVNTALCRKERIEGSLYSITNAIFYDDEDMTIHLKELAIVLSLDFLECVKYGFSTYRYWGVDTDDYLDDIKLLDDGTEPINEKNRKQRINDFLVNVMKPFVDEYADVIDSMSEEDVKLFNKTPHEQG